MNSSPRRSASRRRSFHARTFSDNSRRPSCLPSSSPSWNLLRRYRSASPSMAITCCLRGKRSGLGGRGFVKLFPSTFSFQAALIPLLNLLRQHSDTFLFALLQSFLFAFLESSSQISFCQHKYYLHCHRCRSRPNDHDIRHQFYHLYYPVGPYYRVRPYVINYQRQSYEELYAEEKKKPTLTVFWQLHLDEASHIGN